MTVSRERALAIAVLASLLAPVGAVAGDAPKDPVILLPPAAGGEADGAETIPPGAPADEDLPDPESTEPPPPPEPEIDYVPEPPPAELPLVEAGEPVAPPAAAPPTVPPPGAVATPPVASPPVASPPVASPPVATPPVATPPVATPPVATAPPGTAATAPPDTAETAPVAPAATPRSTTAEPPPVTAVTAPALQTAAVQVEAAAAPARATRVPGGRLHRVARGESLWRIAERILGPAATAAEVAAEVGRLWRLNRERIGTGDPDVLPAGITIVLSGGA